MLRMFLEDLRVLAVVCLTMITFVLSATLSYAEHRDLAPVPDDVVQKLVQGVVAPLDPLAEHLGRHLDDASEIVRQTEEDDSRPHPTAGAAEGALETKRSLIAAKLNELATTRSEVRARFATFRQKLVDLGLPDKVKAWDTLLTQVESRFDRVNRALDDVRTAPDKVRRGKALGKAKQELRDLHHKVKERQAVPSIVPAPTLREGVPAAPSTQPISDKIPQYLSYQNYPLNNVYAFLGDTLLAPPQTPPEAAICNYAPGDTAEDGQEIKFTDEIKALAQQLDYSPVKIYKYVYDTIKFEPYYGSLKGAQGTLISGAGNATDQASLLIALLRASNIPARYVKGQIIVQDSTPLGKDGRGPRWVGAKTYQAAAAILSQGQIPAGTYTINGQLRAIYLDHVWVEACVPYAHYRGASIDNAGHRWIPLDPSFKDNTYQAGITTNVSFDYSGYLASRTDQLPHEKYAEEVETYIKGVGPNFGNNTLQDVGYVGTQTPLKIDILPASLPYRVYQFYNWNTMKWRGILRQVYKQ